MASDKIKVVVGFSRNPKEIGKTQEVDTATAQAWVAEGRARYADPQKAPATKKAGGGKVDATPVDATDRSGDQAGAKK